MLSNLYEQLHCNTIDAEISMNENMMNQRCRQTGRIAHRKRRRVVLFILMNKKGDKPD